MLRMKALLAMHVWGHNIFKSVWRYSMIRNVGHLKYIVNLGGDESPMKSKV